jgi:cobalt/nickel transport system permease protein
MHIPDGILPPEVLIGGYVATVALTAISLRQIRRLPEPDAGIPKAALMTAAFFVASWVHIPVPPTSVHLVLNGVMGVVLGWYALPAMLVGLFLQAVMFQHGGLTTLGVNAAMMGFPAMLAFQIFQLRSFLKLKSPRFACIFAFLGGLLGILLSAGIAFALLVSSIPTYMDVAAEQSAVIALTLAHIPLGIIEGIFSALIIAFLLRVRPEMIETTHAPAP